MAGIGLPGTLLMGARSLNAQRLAIEVTGHNISNVNTPNAARQRVNLVTDIQLNLSLGPQGTGSYASNIESLRSKYLDNQIVKQTFNQGFYDKKASLASLVQETLGENLSTDTTGGVNGASSETGVQNDLNQFYEAYQSLAANPTSLEYRQQVLERARSLAGDIQAIASRLSDVQTDMRSEAGSTATDVNTLSKQIATLNSQIMKVESQTGAPANDLRDQRQEAIENLSKLISIKTSTNATNSSMVDIQIADTTGTALATGGTAGGYLVLGDNAAGTVINGNASTATASVGISATNPALVTLTNSATSTIPASTGLGGELGAIVNVANFVVGSASVAGGSSATTADTVYERLELFATQLATQVNALQNNGSAYDLDNNNNAGNLFSFTAGNAAATISMSLTNGRALAASSAANSPLNSTNASTIANLRDTQISPGSGWTNTSLSEYYRSSVVADTGFIVQQATRDSSTQTLVMNQLTAQRESVSGISIDEEMTNLIRFQRAYEASARLVSVADEMYTKVVNGMGAGR
ncbi:MAG: flagellar hook-associated protein FlgK [Verrucomicrobiota bacterium]